MKADEALARSVLIGHTVKQRLMERCSNISNSDMVIIQKQVELAYLQAIKDIYLDLAARSNSSEVTS